MPAILYFAAIATMFASFVFAEFTPNAPGPGDSYKALSNCSVKWDADSTGSWTNVTINLMSGSNSAMKLVTNVTSDLDGTNSLLSSYTWTCPDVDPYSAIYFYQFTNGGDLQNSKWTARFTISSPSGETTPPPNASQPNGDAISWGTGSLVDSDSDTQDNNNNQSGQNETNADSASPSGEGDGNDTAATVNDGPNETDMSNSMPTPTRMRKTSKPTSDLGGPPTISLPKQAQSPSTHLPTASADVNSSSGNVSVNSDITVMVKCAHAVFVVSSVLLGVILC